LQVVLESSKSTLSIAQHIQNTVENYSRSAVSIAQDTLPAVQKDVHELRNICGI